MKKIIAIILLVFLFNVQFVSKAYASGAFVRIFRSIVQFFKGGADDAIRNSSKSVDEILKKFGKSPEEALSGSKSKTLGETSSLSRTDKIVDLETFVKNETTILDSVGHETHTNHYLSLGKTRKKFINNKKIWKDILEEGAQEGVENITEESFQGAAEEGLKKISTGNDFYTYINLNWIGRIYRTSDYYSKPKVEKTILLVCKTKYEVFYFSILMEEKIKTASLIDHKSLLNSTYPTLPEQELFVLKDLDKFKLMSTQPEVGYNYPKHYFPIGKIITIRVTIVKKASFFYN